MAEQEYLIGTFRYGLDTRKDVLTSHPGTLVACENCHINQGGEIEGRKAFVDLAANTDVAESTTYTIAITSVGTTATVTLATHGLSNGDYVTISGAAEIRYNGTFVVSNVATNTFDYILPLSTTSPATGSPVLAYNATYGLEVTSIGLVVFGSARDYDDVYVSGNPVSSTATKGQGSGATFNITADGTGAITAAVVVAGGVGYAVGDTLTLVTTRGTEAILTVATLAATAVATVTITNNGNSQTEPFLSGALTGVTYIKLEHPSLYNDSTETYNRLYHRLVKVVASTNYNGNTFAIGQFTDGRRFLYYNGVIVQHSANGIAMEGRVSKSDLSNDLLRQLQAVGWRGYANKTFVALTNLTSAAGTATATTPYAHGLTTGDTVEIYGATQVQYNGIFTATVTGGSTFTYPVVGAPASPATVLGNIFATIVESGSTLLMTGVSEFISGIPSDTATSGQLAIKLDTNNVSGSPGVRAVAGFQVTGGAGTFTLTAPETAAGSGSVDLGDGAISTGTTTTETATAIAKAVNSLTYVHGYSAVSDTDKVYVYTNITWGPVTFNLTVVTTGAATTAVIAVAVGSMTVRVTPDPFSATLHIGPPNIATVGVFGTNTGTSVSVTGAVGQVSFSYSFLSGNSGVSVVPVNNSNQATYRYDNRPFGEPVLAPVHHIAAFRVTATDSTPVTPLVASYDYTVDIILAPG